MNPLYRFCLTCLLSTSVLIASAQTLLIDYNYQQPTAQPLGYAGWF